MNNLVTHYTQHCINYYLLTLKELFSFISVIYVNLDNKTSHKCQFVEIDIYALSESWINNLSIDVWFVMIGPYLKIWNLRVQKNWNIEKIIFKVVKMSS